MPMTETEKRHQEGLDAARRLAGWELGDRSWADIIIDAYLHPQATHERLDADEVPSRTGVWR